MRLIDAMPFYLDAKFFTPAPAAVSAAMTALAGQPRVLEEDRAVLSAATLREQDDVDAILNDGLYEGNDAYVATQPVAVHRAERPLTGGVVRLMAQAASEGAAEKPASTGNHAVAVAQPGGVPVSSQHRIAAILIKEVLEAVRGKEFTEAQAEKIVNQVTEIFTQLDEAAFADPERRVHVISQLLMQAIKNLTPELAAALAQGIVQAMIQGLPLEAARDAVVEHVARTFQEISSKAMTRLDEILAANPEIIAVAFDPETKKAEMRLDDEVFLTVTQNPVDNDSDVKVTLDLFFGNPEEAAPLFGKALDLIYNRRIITRGIRNVGDDVPLTGECNIKFRAGATLNVDGKIAQPGDSVPIDLFYKGKIYRVLVPFAVRKRGTGFVK